MEFDDCVHSDSVTPPRKWRNLTALALAELLAMALWFSASAVVPQLTIEWKLSGGQASWMTMSVQIGFVCGTLLSAMLNLADRPSLITDPFRCGRTDGVGLQSGDSFSESGSRPHPLTALPNGGHPCRGVSARDEGCCHLVQGGPWFRYGPLYRFTDPGLSSSARSQRSPRVWQQRDATVAACSPGELGFGSDSGCHRDLVCRNRSVS